jgi:protocatechuate 3,4-dioxygenase beta subunit
MSRSVLVVMVFVFALTTGTGADQERAATAPAIPSTGRIAGTVVNAETGRPVRLAEILLASNAGEQRATTDDTGGFSFEKLPAGSYSLLISRPGFLDSHYGQGRPGTDTPGRRITLKDREEITRLVVPLSQGGSISGVVRDDHGDPVFRAGVRVSRWAFRDGKRMLQDVGAIETDERGMFRVGLLPSRQYAVRVLPPEIFKDEDGKTPSRGFAPVFYPSALSSGGAETIALGVGEHRSNLDLVMPLVKLSKISGMVLDASGQPVPEFHVSLVDQSSGTWLEQGTMTEADGRFQFQRVVPGAYVVMGGALGHLKELSVGIVADGKIEGDVVHMLTSVEAAVLTFKAAGHGVTHRSSYESAAASARGSGSLDVTVSGEVPADVVLRLEGPRDVTGRIVFDGAAQKPAANIDVLLRSPTSAAFQASVAADGTFTLKDVAPGRYSIEAKGPGSPWTLASAVSTGVDALDSQLDVPRDRDLRDLTLTFSDRVTELSGTVTDASGQPVTERRVIVFSSDERLWTTAMDRIQATALTEAGRFTFTDLRPGSYWLGVVGDVEADEWRLPEFLRQLVGASVPVRILDGEKKTQDLRVR